MSGGYDFLADEAYGANRVENQRDRDRLIETGNNDNAYDDYYGQAPDLGDESNHGDNGSRHGSMDLSEIDDRASSFARQEPAAAASPHLIEEAPEASSQQNFIEEEAPVSFAERRGLRNRAMAIRTQSVPGSLSPGRHGTAAGFLPRTPSLVERGVEQPISRSGTAFEDRGTWKPKRTAGLPGDFVQRETGNIGADQGSSHMSMTPEGSMALLADSRSAQEAKNSSLRETAKLNRTAVPDQARVPLGAGVQPVPQARVGHRLWSTANRLTRKNQSWGARIRNFFAQSSFLRRLGLTRSHVVGGSAREQTDRNYSVLNEKVKESDFAAVPEASELDEQDDDESSDD
jgi:hypothetical protein